MKLQKKSVVIAAVAFALTAALQCLATFDVFGPLDKMTAGLLILAVCLAEFFLLTGAKRGACVCEEGLRFRLTRIDRALFSASFIAAAAASLSNIKDFSAAANSLLPDEKLQPYLYFRLAVTALAVICAALFTLSAFSGKSGIRTISLLSGAVFAFLVMVAESAYLMPLPNIVLYLPRIFAFYCTACWFTGMCMSSKSGLASETARVFDFALLSLSYCLGDAAFWLFHSPSAYRPMPLYVLVFDIAAAVCAVSVLARGKDHVEAVSAESGPDAEEKHEI